MKKDDIQLVSLKTFLDFIEDDETDMFFTMLMLQNPKLFSEFMNAKSYLDIGKIDSFHKMMDTDSIYIKWQGEKMKFVRFDKDVIKNM